MQAPSASVLHSVCDYVESSDHPLCKRDLGVHYQFVVWHGLRAAVAIPQSLTAGIGPLEFTLLGHIQKRTDSTVVLARPGYEIRDPIGRRATVLYDMQLYSMACALFSTDKLHPFVYSDSTDIVVHVPGDWVIGGSLVCVVAKFLLVRGPATSREEYKLVASHVVSF
ncbi:hypothetical protein B0H14DRAFT_3854939 [Mycena olivaceomarginata]|nr:hypothetical protein B0H14DRAFT_3854939 [Mycena olivaceomarginata]